MNKNKKILLCTAGMIMLTAQTNLLGMNRLLDQVNTQEASRAQSTFDELTYANEIDRLSTENIQRVAECLKRSDANNLQAKLEIIQLVLDRRTYFGSLRASQK